MTAQYRPYKDEDDATDTDHFNWSDEPSSIQIYEKTTEALPFQSRRRFVISAISAILVSIIAGFLLGYYSHSDHVDCVYSTPDSLHAGGADSTIRDKLFARIDSGRLRSTVKDFSREARVAGSLNNYVLAKKVADAFREHGLDRVEVKNYTVVLSLPDENLPSFVETVHHERRNRIFSTENHLPGRSNESPFAAYSPEGSVTGDIVFVNYGQAADYKILHELNIDLNGKILIAKHWPTHTPDQAYAAQDVSAAGLLLYSDTGSSEWVGEESNSNLPRDAVRRESLLWNGMGDPATPSYPALPYTYRRHGAELAMLLPKIPVLPISMAAAHDLLRLMGGRRAPNDWQGSFNFTYHIGPGFQNSDFKTHLEVNTVLVNKTIQNVIGYIKGDVEPDRYVLIGNHRDSWTKGAIDAGGGSAVLLELSKVFGGLVKEGWRPRRTLMFCSWDAEEFNLIGSTEWLEENLKIVQARAVAYVSTDIIAAGNASISVSSSPLLYQLVFNATKDVANPNGRGSLYEQWLAHFPLKRNSSNLVFGRQVRRSGPEDVVSEFDYDYERVTFHENLRDVPSVDIAEPAHGSLLSSFINSVMLKTRPRVRSLDMRGSYAPFFTYAGIPAVEITYIPLADDSSQASSTYPLIHTQYDTFELIEQFDKDFKCHKAVAQTIGEIVRNLADSLFLPFNLLDYAQILKDMYNSVNVHAATVLTSSGVDLVHLESAVHNFTVAALKFHSRQDDLNVKDPLAVRRVNDQLMLLERAFLDSEGLPKNPIKKHIIMSPSELTVHNDEMFPGLMDEFALLINADFADLHEWSYETVQKHFSALLFVIQSAADVISEVV
ncbi:N-acetylated-alpha-linked acidic dipeptidase 2 [Halotydeus destructor]|nr:N-acetylated-alpha-linked acidic dipeptidase 2 [Halotydeus destructor]